MKKKSGAGKVVLAGGVTVAILAGLAFSATQDWKTGRNALVDYGRAEMGDAQMQYELGTRALESKAPGEGPDKAIVWFEKSARGGNVKAMLALGDLYNDRPDEASGDLAVKWYGKASDAGSMEATAKLGSAYDIGRGTLTPDRSKARPLFEKAAKGGDPMGEMFFGVVLLQEGQLKAGEAWLLKASKAGNAQADGTLGNLYYDAYSPLKDMDKAFYYYGRACNAGVTPVMLNFAYMHYNGVATRKDPAEAYKWILIAADANPRQMRLAIVFMKQNLSPAELADGEKRAAAWRKAHLKPV